MHELSVAQNIIDIVTGLVKPGEREQVRSITLRIGEMAGIVPDSLEFSFRVLTETTDLRNASLAIERVPVTARCSECGVIGDLPYAVFYCQACGSHAIEVRSGQELQVVEITLEDRIGADV